MILVDVVAKIQGGPINIKTKKNKTILCSFKLDDIDETFIVQVYFYIQCITRVNDHALARVSIVDEKLEVVYDKLVKPREPITDYLTK